MKKTLAVLAVLAVAAVAQAELLATWTITGGAQSDVKNENDALQFGQLTANGLNGTYTSTQWRLNNWANTTVAGSTAVTPTGQLDASFTLASGNTFTLESITSTLNGGGNPAPAQFAWYNGDTPVTGINTALTASRTPTAVTWSGNGNGVWTENGTISLRANGNASNGSASAAGTSWTSLQTTELYGTVSGDTPTPPTPSVPEPATMSLLGIGALAMALRRKLRK